MIKRCMQEHEIDPKRFAPRAIKSAISSAKNQLVDATDYGESVGSPFEETVADVYALYERRMVEASAMDFDDLLVRTVNLLELFADVRDEVPPNLPLGPRRRVPGHQPRAVPDAAAAGRGGAAI